MSRDYDPVPGKWYEDLDTEEIFKVLSLDPDEELVRIQWLDRELEDLDLDVWNEMDLELASEPEGWADDDAGRRTTKMTSTTTNSTRTTTGTTRTRTKTTITTTTTTSIATASERLDLCPAGFRVPLATRPTSNGPGSPPTAPRSPFARCVRTISTGNSPSSQGSPSRRCTCGCSTAATASRARTRRGCCNSTTWTRSPSAPSSRPPGRADRRGQPLCARARHRSGRVRDRGR